MTAQPSATPRPGPLQGIRALDFTPKPDTTYRYRVRIVVFNPNHGRDDISPEAGKLKDKTELTGPWSEPTDEVQMPADVSAYAMDVLPANPKSDIKIDFQVVKFDPADGVTLTWVRSWISRYGMPCCSSGTTRQRSVMASSSAGVHRSSRNARTASAPSSRDKAPASSASRPSLPPPMSCPRRFMAFRTNVLTC